MSSPPDPTRFVGLDIHRHYVVAAGVDANKNQVLGPRRIEIFRFEEWVCKHLTRQDAVVLEMTTNTYEVYDILKPHVHSVTVVHPPHVALVVRAQVKTDEKAALTLARLHAVGLIPAIWIPPDEVRDLRALVAERHKLVKLQTQAKNRLHSVLHRCHILLPEGCAFSAKHRDWWNELPISALEKARIRSYMETLQFVEGQLARLEATLGEVAAPDSRLPILVQLPGVALITGMTILGAIGDISRFPDASHLVGYAGLGARVHDSGQTHKTGRITKTGRRDLRSAMIEVAQSAARTHPHWKEQLARLEVRIGRKKAIVAIARKLLVAVWHVLTYGEADRFALPQKVACSMFALAYKVGVRNLPDGQSATVFTRSQLGRLGLGQELESIPWGRRRVKLPAPPVAKAGSLAGG